MSEVFISIDVASDFSAYPAGREPRDGPFNGTRFREDVLVPRLEEAMHKGGKVTVDFGGVRSFGSSFLEEAFGGLVRAGFAAEAVKQHLDLQLKGPGHDRYLRAINLHIDQAQARHTDEAEASLGA